jgi:hypothetical protein
MVIKSFSSHTIFSLCCTLIVLSCAAHSCFTKSINPCLVGPFDSKNLGDFAQEYSQVNELLTAILESVLTVGAHKFTWRKQGLSCCLFVCASIHANNP